MELFRACQDAISLEKMYNTGIKFSDGIRVSSPGKGWGGGVDPHINTTGVLVGYFEKNP